MWSQIQFYLTRSLTSILLVLTVLFLSYCEKKRPDFTSIKLKDYYGKEISISSFEEDYVIYTFLSPECPLSENYTKTLKDLQQEYKGKNLTFCYVFPGKFYHQEQIEHFVGLYFLPEESVFYDPMYQLKKYCDANITPEVFMIDQLGQIHYEGAIDNWAITLGKQRQVITEHYLRDAMNDLLADSKVKVRKTRAVGCIIE